MEAAAYAAGAGAGAGLGLLGALWLGAGAALRTWNRPRARGYGRHMGQRPAVAVVLPVKGHHAHSEANWMNQLAMDYEGGDVQVRGVPGRTPVRAADTRRTDSSDRRRRRRRGLGWKQGLTDRDADPRSTCSCWRRGRTRRTGNCGSWWRRCGPTRA